MVRENRAVDMISDQLLATAKKLREDLPGILSDVRLTDDERAEAMRFLEPHAVELEAQAEWWRTGRRSVD